MTIDVAYYAVLREQRGLSRESIETEAATPMALYRELRAAHGFRLDGSLLRAAVNGAFVPMDEALGDGDSVVFIPPVAGG